MSALTPCLGVVAEALDDGDAEAEGLAGAGLGLADDVLAGEAEGDGLLLDGEGVDDALRGECVDDVWTRRRVRRKSSKACLSVLPESDGEDAPRSQPQAHGRGSIARVQPLPYRRLPESPDRLSAW